MDCKCGKNKKSTEPCPLFPANKKSYLAGVITLSIVVSIGFVCYHLIMHLFNRLGGGI